MPTLHFILRHILSLCCVVVLMAGGVCTSNSARAGYAEGMVDEFGGTLASESSPANYAASLSNELHWAHFPVRVAFVNSISVGSQNLDTVARRGFGQWVRATQNAVEYEVVSNPSRADITVTFEEVTERPGNGGKLGTTGFRYNRSRRVLTHADMHLNVWDRMSRRDLVRFENTAAHEFGHALGINGHSPNPDDLMYFSSSQADGVTSRDVNTLRLAYHNFARPTANNARTNSKTRL